MIMIIILERFKFKSMKKYLILTSAALIALAACNKEPVEAPELSNDAVNALTFTSARPQLDTDTKTAWDATTSSIVWQSDDKIKVGFTFDNAWWAQSTTYASSNENPNDHIKFYQSGDITIDSKSSNIATFTVPTTFVGPTTSGDFVFYAVYPAALVGNNLDTAPSATVTLNTSQSPATNSFDATTDIMVGTSETITSTGLPSDAIELNWNRVVAHAALTFSNMAFDGTEVPSKVTLTFNDEAKVAGSFSVNIADGTIGAGSANEIVLEGSGLSVSGSSISAWATVLPVSFTSLNVEVKTDKATYVRSITGLSKTFKKNARNTLKINMATASRNASEQFDWVKKNLSEITSSDVFVIVGNNGNDFAMSNDKGTSSAPGAIAVTVANNKLSVAPAEKLQWTLSKDGGNYTFYPNGTTDTWLYVYNNNNGLRVGTGNDKVFTITDGYLYNSGQERYIGIYTSSDWRSYTSINNNIKGQTFAFYVKSTATPSKPVPTISFGTPATEVNIGETVTNVATIDPSTLTVTYYSSSDEEVATVSDAGVVTGVAIGTATITATFAGDDNYDETSANYEISVVDPNANDGSEAKPYTASEAAALALGGSTATDMYVKGIISSIAVPYSNNVVSFYISDDGLTSSTQFEVYKTYATSENDYKVGDAVVFKGTFTKYNSTPEFAAGSSMISQLHAPSFNPDGGSFTTDTQSITVTADAGAEIRYTTDGNTTPTASVGTVYSAPISISETTVIKAIAVKDGLVTGVISKTFTKSSGGEEITLQYTGSTINMGTENEAETVGLSAEDWSVIADKGEASYNVGLNQAGDIRLYWNANGSNTLTVSSLKGATINYITIEYTGDSYSNGKVLVDGNEVSLLNGTYQINKTSFAITNGNTTNVQVRIRKIVINYTPSN